MELLLRGGYIGIVHSGSGKIIALRPVEVYSEDYALLEYGISARDMSRIEKKLMKQGKREQGRIWDGSAESLRR